MAINWTTYRSIPFLKDYSAAKQWHDDVVPIRGDEHKTRPCGRRDQKWFSIWEAEGAIHVGYGSGELDKRTKLVTFQKSGTILLHRPYRYGASTHDRLFALLGPSIHTHQYDSWVYCTYFDNGERRDGWLPLHAKVTNFVRDGERGLVFIDYKFPVTHTMNKEKLKEVLRPFVPFLTYVEGLAKLQGNIAPKFEAETVAEIFGWHDEERGLANSVPSLNWGVDVMQHRSDMLALATSDDHYDRLKAAVMLYYQSHWGIAARNRFMDQLMRVRASDILDKREHRDGRKVTDRYRRYIP